MKVRILFTKKLSKEYIQKELGDTFDVFFLPVITTKPIKGDIEIGNCKHFIFTSLQGVNAIKEKIYFPNDAEIYVVGEKSKYTLETLGYPVKVTAKNSLELFNRIQEFDPVEVIHFCSSKVLPTLRNKLSKLGFKYTENVVYETQPLYPVQNTRTDALVFFSPSGVESFMKKNSITNEKLFSIGESTSNRLKSFTNKNIITSQHENLKNLLQVIKNSYND